MGAAWAHLFPSRVQAMRARACLRALAGALSPGMRGRRLSPPRMTVTVEARDSAFGLVTEPDRRQRPMTAHARLVANEERL
jgi:hypothetical protein